VDDSEILGRLRGEETTAQSAFDDLFRSSYARLVRMGMAVVRDQAVAEELVQDVLLELWRRRTQIALDVPLQAYLIRATRNRALNHVRHVKVEQRGAVLAAADNPRAPAAAHEAEAGELDAAYRRALDDLTPRCREVFEMSRVQGLRYSEIAASLGISVKAVEAHMGKALRSLRERLAAWLPNGERF
jgi:RNA polymerase sigma-70 factor, ECF subfamily